MEHRYLSIIFTIGAYSLQQLFYLICCVTNKDISRDRAKYVGELKYQLNSVVQQKLVLLQYI
jgi:hypothetical protein